MRVGAGNGATRELGSEVADVRRSAGHVVDEAEADDVESVAPYGAIVLGSGTGLLIP